MFDDYHNHQHHHSSDTRVNVTENRAPTDQSVKLLREMEQAARDKVIKSTVVQDTVFECVLHAFDDILNDRKEVVAIFSLNGQKREARFSCLCQDDDIREKIAIGIRDAVAKEIAMQMIGTSFKKINTFYF